MRPQLQFLNLMVRAGEDKEWERSDMGNKFASALEIFEGALIGMSGWATRPVEDGDPTPEERRQRCLAKFDELKKVWDRDPLLLQKIEGLVNDCVKSYAAGDYERGDFAAKDVEEIIWKIRAKKS